MAAYRLERTCTVDDAAGLAKNNMSAFWEEKSWNLLWEDGSLPNRITAGELRMPRQLLTSRDVRRHQKVVETATGDIVGYARWILPESLKDQWLESQTPNVSDEDRRRFDELFSKAIFRPRNLDSMDNLTHVMQAKHEPKKPYLELDYLAVRPDHQRHGIASILVQSGIETANKLGVDIFLVATAEKAVGMYERNGFEVLDQVVQSLAPWGGKEEDLYKTFSVIKHPSV